MLIFLWGVGPGARRRSRLHSDLNQRAALSRFLHLTDLVNLFELLEHLRFSLNQLLVDLLLLLSEKILQKNLPPVYFDLAIKVDDILVVFEERLRHDAVLN
jgi:hypothetical protein